MFIDTHAHLNFDEFKNDLDEVLFRAKEARIEKIINIGCEKESCDSAVDLAKRYSQCYASLGVHPYDAKEMTEELLMTWEKQIQDCGKIVAIGECGLDYFKAKIPRELQKKAFIMQILFAQKMRLPLVVHNREADEDCLQILQEYNAFDNLERVKVVFHCFGSDLEFAKMLWKEGYMTSFTGIVTFPNAGKLLDVVREVPFDRFMIETDCPYLAPQAYRGQRNEPSYVVDVLKKIAEIKAAPLKEIEELAYINSLKFFDRL